ncbi:MAG: flagellar hook-length control protein FliK [Candidatus Hydrogenedentes bacterium]|nr:flagellar hook-length control protein FliK [Candidatus Hydrogenedentota bacterium]
MAALPGQAALQAQVGQVLQGMIQSTNEGLFLIAGQLRVQVPARSDLVPGQPVTAEVVARNAQDGSIQLRITPQATASTTQPAVAQTALADMVDAILRALGAVDLPENTTPLLPPQLPPTPEAARAALSFFAVRAQMGPDIEQVAARIQEAVQAGVPMRAETRAAATLLSRLVASEPDSFEPVLRQWLSEAGASTEARVAQALTSGSLDRSSEPMQTDVREAQAPASGSPDRLSAPLQTEARVAQALASDSPDRLSALMQTDVRAALTQVRNDPALANYLRARGELPGFQDALARVANRVDGSQLQNVRGTDIPYWVSEIPFAPGGPIRDGLVHFLPEGRQSHGRTGSDYATVALDLSTTRLGDLWVTLQVGGGECHCRVKASETPAVEALRAAAKELETGLVQAGYARPTIQISEWDGNRLRETATLLQRYAGFQVKA